MTIEPRRRNQIAALGFGGVAVSNTPWETAEIALAAATGGELITLGDTVLETCARISTSTTAGGNLDNLDNPVTITDPSLAFALDFGNVPYVMCESEIMYVREVDGNDITLLRGRADTFVRAHSDGVPIFAYQQGTPGSIPVPMGPSLSATDLDSRIKDYLKQEAFLFYPELELRARVYQPGWICFFRPQNIDSSANKACSTDLVGATIKTEFRPQYGTILAGPAGASCTLGREITQDDIDFPGSNSGAGEVCFITEFNTLQAGGRGRINAGLNPKEVGYSAGGVLVGPRSDQQDDCLVQQDTGGGSAQRWAAGDRVTISAWSEEGNPEYLRDADPVSEPDPENQQTFWGPDPHMPEPRT